MSWSSAHSQRHISAYMQTHTPGTHTRILALTAHGYRCPPQHAQNQTCLQPTDAQMVHTQGHRCRCEHRYCRVGTDDTGAWTQMCVHTEPASTRVRACTCPHTRAPLARDEHACTLFFSSFCRCRSSRAARRCSALSLCSSSRRRRSWSCFSRSALAFSSFSSHTAFLAAVGKGPQGV